MKCPKCGAKMKDGQMYCEKCGSEIQIVPEFEPEIENSIHATLSDVASEIKIGQADRPKEQIFEEGAGHEAEEGTQGERKNKTIRHKRMPFITAGILFLIAAALLYVFFSNQPGKLYQKALRQMENGRPAAALASLENAVTKDPDNLIYRNELADCYLAVGDIKKAQESCLDILKLDGTDGQALERLIKIYQKQEAYEEINTLLQDCKNREIKNRYLDYMANEPVFDRESGTYREKITVKLIANAAGTLYYTLDGSKPTTQSRTYTAPFTLEEGSFTIKAFFVNQYGIESSIAEASYVVDVSKPDAPAVEPESGEYEIPGLICVTVPENCKVYYTTDRTEPGIGSFLYEGPFPMLAGYSTFHFAVCDEGGIFGEITQRQYYVNLHAALSMEAAANQLLLTLKNAGILLNLQGAVPEKNGRNVYTYKYALTIEENHYYLYREYYEEVNGSSNVTGNDYVVNYMSGECYRAILQEDKSYRLEMIGENQSPREAER